jgi:hypothetical protein
MADGDGHPCADPGSAEGDDSGYYDQLLAVHGVPL